LKIAEADILIAPGLGNSGPEHWQRRWGERMNTARIIEQDDWNAPLLTDWVDRIHQEIMLATRPVVLIGHSLACSAIVHTAQLRLKDTKVRGAFLVSPPDLERDDMPEEIHAFRNVPTDPLPFPSMVVGSTSDPYGSYERLQGFAADWGSAFQSAGDAGHINVASGHGPWPEGLLMFAELMKRLRA
jgi:predicted alpha/beta hydrolase family esterase